MHKKSLLPSPEFPARRVIRELESLRNNLAHSQDFVTHDWAQIARLAQRIHELCTADFSRHPQFQSEQATQ